MTHAPPQQPQQTERDRFCALFPQLYLRFHRRNAPGHALGGASRATLLQFSSAFCAPCRTTRVVLEEVVGMVDGVAHVEVDAESHLDLVRRLDVRRTPTVLVLDSAGLVRVRAAGAPRKADVIAALGQVG